MRESSIPNQRAQEGMKLHLFCEKCEKKFGKLETRFSNEIFQPIIRSEDDFEYEYNSEWIRRFYISIAWRYLVVSLSNNTLVDFTPDEFEYARKKAEEWREYLISDYKVCDDVVRLFPLTAKYIDKGSYPDDIPFVYFNRTNELLVEISKSGHWSYVYIKTPYFIGIVDIISSNEILTTGAEVGITGKLFSEDILLPDLIEFSMVRNFNRIVDSNNHISLNQWKIIVKSAKRNWADFEKSETWNAMNQDGYTKEALMEIMKRLKERNHEYQDMYCRS